MAAANRLVQFAQQKRSLTVPKFYVQSQQVQYVLEAQDAQQAAITAFQWWCERQAEALFIEESDDCQLGNEILVSEIGFDGVDAESFATLDILMAWQANPVRAGS